MNVSKQVERCGHFIGGTVNTHNKTVYTTWSAEGRAAWNKKEPFLVCMGDDIVYVNEQGMCYNGKKPTKHYPHFGECRNAAPCDFAHYVGLVVKSGPVLAKALVATKVEPTIEWW